MKRIVLIAVAAVALVGVVFAQATGADQNSSTANSGAPATQAPANASPTGSATANANAVAEGTAINAELAKGVDAKKAKENDQIQAKVTQDVLVGGKVVVPRNSKLLGHVTQVKAGGKGEASTLGIAFDKAVLKGGQEVPLHGAIQALAPAARMPGGGSASYGDDMPAGSPPSGGGGGYNTTGGAGGMAAPRTGPQGVGGGSPQPATPAGGMGSPNEGAGNAPGMSSSGQLTSASRGVMGMPGVMLNSGAGGSGSVLTNDKKTVKLDSGTQMVVRVTAQ